ncbi:glycosyltransferase [Flavobacterium humi]|uniref:glycosyltransferase n=1 Tax=Flavobacterium humi TaxID=2562683 RepID=UPI001469F7BE|nr:glycosyltransferase [Flavobacterium humi]
MVSECLSTGGAERVAALLSHFFVSKGIEIHHVIVLDSVVYDYSGELLNLGKLKNESNSVANKWKRFFTFKKYIQHNNFDYIIDFRVKNNFYQEWIISKWVYKTPKIYTVRSYFLKFYFPKSKWLAQRIHNGAFGIVANTEKIRENVQAVYGFKKVNTIYNPIAIDVVDLQSREEPGIDFQYIVCAGRMNDNVKQFDKLMEAYSNSVLPSHNIKLIVLGDGKQRKALENRAAALQLESMVLFYGHVKNPFQYYKNAKFFVLSSKFEGMPNVILESLACGTPVVSFDCLSGPSEMITHKENGLLVENQNVSQLTQAIDLFVEDEKLYHYCKGNARESIRKFSLENIGKQWLEYLKINVS